jgi:hypothetical protein
VITVDLTTTPVAGELRLPQATIDALAVPPAPANDTRWIYYSSGTTAAPKGIRHTDASVIAAAGGLVRMIGVTSSDVDPIAFPIAHIGAAVMLAAALLTGMRLASLLHGAGAGRCGLRGRPRIGLCGWFFRDVACLAAPCRRVRRASHGLGAFVVVGTGRSAGSWEGGADAVPGGRDRYGPAPGGIDA